MGKIGGKKSEYRARMEGTLGSPELKDHEALKTLVRNQLQHSSVNEAGGCSEALVEKHTTKVFHFLEMLRSASIDENQLSKATETSHSEWKLKDDNEEFRVMYRPGPEGTPFHTLLVEGYVDGPLDACLCISWESTLYQKWWPQFSFPPFKITVSQCLQKVRVDEQISLIRLKVPWPVSAREVILHYFLFEYLKDDLVVVLLNAISDSENMDVTTHGFSKDVIPEQKEVVRVGLVGGYAIQKVTSGRSFFRTIANVDFKLDFVPPSFINFISRQLIGSGFRLYKKAVTTHSDSDLDYVKALEDPMYTRIREALHFKDGQDGTLEGNNHIINATQNNLKDLGYNGTEAYNEEVIISKNDKVKDITDFGEIKEERSEESGQVKDENNGVEQRESSNNCINGSFEFNALGTDRKVTGEIEEEDMENKGHADKGLESIESNLNKMEERSFINHKRGVAISPEVEQALETLEKAICMVREYGFNSLGGSLYSLTNVQAPNPEMGAEKDLTFPKGRTVGRTSHEWRISSASRETRRTGSSSYTRDNRIAPASPDASPEVRNERNRVSPRLKSGIGETPLVDLMAWDDTKVSEADNKNSFREEKKMKQQIKHISCCFGLSPRRTKSRT